MMKFLITGALALLTLTACATSFQAQDEEPARFHILSERELQLDMQTMANSISAIAFIALDSDMAPDQQQARVLFFLDSIRSIATDIDHDHAVTNYSAINRYMGAFLHDVGVAREFAAREPPNLVPAQRLIKSCLSCHDSI